MNEVIFFHENILHYYTYMMYNYQNGGVFNES